MSPDLELALRLADVADSISLPRFRSGLAVETKADPTPVTEADRQIEADLRKMLAAERPGDAILGAEEGASAGGARRWVIDPIDGTRNYSRGVPVWATLVAHEEQGVVQIVVVSAPALGHRWWAERGSGAYADGERIHVSAVSRIEDAVLSFAVEDELLPIARRAWHARGFGDFWAHMLVAEGSVDIAIEPELNLWDMAAVIPIVTEAGGTFTALDGSPALSGGNGLSTNGVVHDQVLALLDATATFRQRNGT